MSLTASKPDSSVKDRVSTEEWEARVNLAAANRLVAQHRPPLSDQSLRDDV